MTLQEIENLKLDDYSKQMKYRVSFKKEIELEEVTLDDISKEFDLYKIELTQAEEQRLNELERRNILQSRIDSLGTDIGKLVTEYLKDKDYDSNGYNSSAFSIKHISNSECKFWRFKNVAKPTLEQLEEISTRLENIETQKDNQKAWNILRGKRDKFLLETDHSQLADAPYVSEEKARYRQYRTYLRNLPSAHTQESIDSAIVKTFEEFKADL